VLAASYLYKHLIQTVGIAGARVPAPKTFGKFWAEFIDPESNSFVADANVALR